MFKENDQVMVTVPGTVYSVNADAGFINLMIPGESALQVIRVSVDDCTPVEPEIALPEVPGTIVQVDPLNEHGERAVFMHDPITSMQDWCPWQGADDATTTEELAGLCRRFGYRVIPAATEEVENA